EALQMAETARRAFVFTAVAVVVVAGALALWKLRLLIALLFLAFIVAAAMRPGVDRMSRRHIPRPLGVAVQYAALFAVIGLLLWAVVPRATEQVREAVAGLPGSSSEIRQKAEESSGLERELLVGLQRWLEDLPSGSELVDPALEAGILGFEILIGIFFVLATAAYWIFERDTAVRLFTSLLPAAQRKVARDTWDLIDLKLGAYVRGQALLILLVGTVLSLLFWAIGLPYWLLIGAFAGVVEIVPVIGPLAAGTVAVGVGLTDSWQVGVAAGITVLVVRLAEDYLVIPRVLGGAVGMSPLIVLVAITGTAILFGEFAVLLAVPIAAVAATLVEVLLLEKDPADEDVPTVLFPAKEAEPAGRR
ncbi:MAG: AI-2E family transporter, partial [Actinomycetota bacterium]|nr:AI-2E family transporter [Actinomycetota bacterium]